METESALYQPMGVRMYGVMNGITNSDGQYQDIIRRSDVYSDRLEEMELPEEVRLLIDRYVSEQNAHSSCAIDPGMGCSPTCLVFLTAGRCFWKNGCLQNRNRCPKNTGKGLEMQALFFVSSIVVKP